MLTFLRKGLTLLCLLATCLSALCADIGIIESQSASAVQNMDIKWENVAINIGHNPVILPQSALDDLNHLLTYDMLIISSGMVNIPANRQTTIQAFIELGRPVYIQAEYLVNLPGNMAFENIVQNLGGSFSWNGTANGALVPMTISGTVANNLNNTPTLNYYWYGAFGSGDANTHSYMHYNGQDFGFIYCSPDPSHGLLATNSDQDWVRTDANPGLMANIITVLLNDLPSFQPVLSVIDETGIVCEGETHTYTANLGNFTGNCQIQWQANGQDLPGIFGNSISSNNLQEGVAISFKVIIPGTCGPAFYYSDVAFVDHVDEPETPSLTLQADKTLICGNEMVHLNAGTGSTLGLNNLSYTWYINEVPQPGATQESFSFAFAESSVVRCEIDYDTQCNPANIISSETIQITIDPFISPVLNISSDEALVCQGDTLNFNAAGEHLGSAPVYQWYLDGSPVGDNSPAFTSNTLLDGQLIQCFVMSSLNCAEINDAVSNAIAVSLATNCSSSESQSNVSSEEPSVFIPNAFSPNGDGVNDMLSVFASGPVEMVTRFGVYDRHGNKVFSQINLPVNDNSTGWDGSFQGKRLPVGVYLYALEVALSDGSSKLYRGDVTIVY